MQNDVSVNVLMGVSYDKISFKGKIILTVRYDKTNEFTILLESNMFFLKRLLYKMFRKYKIQTVYLANHVIFNDIEVKVENLTDKEQTINFWLECQVLKIAHPINSSDEIDEQT